LKPFVLAKVM